MTYGVSLWYTSSHMSEHLKENVKLRLDSELLRRLERLADKGDRNVSQEMRRGLRWYADAEEAKNGDS